ncbi:MAG: hypothetical protein KGL53_13020, partial [Elusimicrobia bacterium]|nr:hypothetical protein [Elusimicrobiota bacterium]
MGNNLFVTGFPYETTQQELHALFAPFGTVLNVKILMDRATGRSRGMGFVVMGTDPEAQAAVAKLNGSLVGHRKIFVNEARPSDKHGAGGYAGPERRSGKDRRRGWGPASRSEGRPWDKDKKPGFGSRKPWDKDKKPGFGDRKPWDKDKKPGFGDRKPWDKDKKPGFGSRKPWDKDKKP